MMDRLYQMCPRTRQLRSISLLIDRIIHILIPICFCVFNLLLLLSEITIMLFCSLCHTQFSSGFSLRRHQNTKHNETFSGSNCTTKYSLFKKTYTYIQIKLTFHSKIQANRWIEKNNTCPSRQ